MNLQLDDFGNWFEISSQVYLVVGMYFTIRCMIDSRSRAVNSFSSVGSALVVGTVIAMCWLWFIVGQRIETEINLRRAKLEARKRQMLEKLWSDVSIMKSGEEL